MVPCGTIVCQGGVTTVLSWYVGAGTLGIVYERGLVVMEVWEEAGRVMILG